MDKEAEHFRKVTMRVLTMQLNSISVMDLVAFGGAALGILLAIFEFQNGNINLIGMIVIILLSSEFFIPLRLLGSFFHIAMNGMAASDKIFKILDMEIDSNKTTDISLEDMPITLNNVNFSYQEDRQILKDVNVIIPKQSCIALVGSSGCGKSTIANIISGYHSGYQGSIQWGDTELSTISEDSLFEQITLVNHDGYVFAGTIAYNLQMVGSHVTETKMWEVLKLVKLDAFVKEQGGLSMPLLEQGSNLSGGQKQRLVLARALLKDTPVYVFDEATSNIDVESENTIMEVIYNLKKTKTLILISHRLDNIKNADQIYMMETGAIVEQGTHQQLLNKEGAYATMYQQQADLLSITKGVNNDEEKC
ncbi:MAG: ABC transporter ATP-binding protein/permease [Coprobacillaceae bacterium]